MLKPYSGEKKFKSRQNGAQNGGFGGNGGPSLRYWFRDKPEESLAEENQKLVTLTIGLGNSCNLNLLYT